MPRDDGITMTWFVKVEGRVYGPYTGAQMRAFITEGRVAAHSIVSGEREGEFAAASATPQLKAWLDEARRAPNEKRPLPADAKTANFIIAAELTDDSRRRLKMRWASSAMFSRSARVCGSCAAPPARPICATS
jgi:hypothetical protein